MAENIRLCGFVDSALLSLWEGENVKCWEVKKIRTLVAGEGKAIGSGKR
jgi:hypothetical protein